MKYFLLLILVALTGQAIAEPKQLLEDYFRAIDTTEFKGLGENFDPDQLADIGRLVKNVSTSTAPTAAPLKKQLLGGESKPNQPAAVYLERIMEILVVEAGSMDFAIEEHHVIGELPEGDDQLHIVARVTLVQGDKEAHNVNLYSFRRVGEEWFMRLPSGLTGFLELIEMSANPTR